MQKVGPGASIGWGMSIAASIMFVYAAFQKLGNNEGEVAMYVNAGIPIWVMYLAGVLELLGVAALLFTKKPLIGAGILAVVGIGAVVQHLAHGQQALAPVPLIVIAIAVGGAILRQPPAIETTR
jgi:uncharacterized membrane protein YphA (DoxX/SURF4 family)